MRYRVMLEAMKREEAGRRLASENLKVCPLCSAVNALMSSECFVCRWAGDFSYDADDIEDGIVDILARCPELVDVLIPTHPPKRTVTDRIRTFFTRRRVQRQLDLLA